jgi:hypothetical protein
VLRQSEVLAEAQTPSLSATCRFAEVDWSGNPPYRDLPSSLGRDLHDA